MSPKLDVISLVHFGNQKRVPYLERSFNSFYQKNSNIRHWVIDGSSTIGAQDQIYKKFQVNVIHKPNMAYGQRLKAALEYIESDYFIFFPDDFEWILEFPMSEAIKQCRTSNIQELKLTCRGMEWFSQPGATPKPWFDGSRVMSGEVLRKEGDLYLTRRRLFRDAHEKFSLACNLIQTQFARYIFNKIRSSAQNPSRAEIDAYLWLLVSNYAVGYYKMWIPAFHFMDLSVEPDNELNRLKQKFCMHPKNYEVYNKHYNR